MWVSAEAPKAPNHTGDAVGGPDDWGSDVASVAVTTLIKVPTHVKQKRK
jgi:hypothetical protein